MSRAWLQGHRGARGLKPENTLPSFETAFDLCLQTVETDVHLTRDGVPVLSHDPVISDRLCRLLPRSTSPHPATRPLISRLSLAELRGYRADCNPDPVRFPKQDASVTPLARLFADERGIDPYAIPTLEELFAFTAAYAGELGKRAGKTPQQQGCAQYMILDLELKRVPFHPEFIGDDFTGDAPGLLEARVLDCVQANPRPIASCVRSFDHRCVRLLGALAPWLTAVALIEGTAPVDPVALVEHLGAREYAPAYRFLDESQVRRLHAAGIRVVPWTVNDPADGKRLCDWGVDGITTDFPDRFQ